jgi:hypothetical protein
VDAVLWFVVPLAVYRLTAVLVSYLVEGLQQGTMEAAVGEAEWAASEIKFV